MSKRGRPAVYVGSFERAIAGVVRKYGLTKGRSFLATVGVQVKPGLPKQAVSVSMPTLGKIAHRYNIALKRGRPALAA